MQYEISQRAIHFIILTSYLPVCIVQHPRSFARSCNRFGWIGAEVGEGEGVHERKLYVDQIIATVVFPVCTLLFSDWDSLKNISWTSIRLDYLNEMEWTRVIFLEYVYTVVTDLSI